MTPEDAKCRSAIAKFSGNYVKTLGKVIVTCHRDRDKGKLDALTDCNDAIAADTAGKAAKAALAVSAGIVSACADAPYVLAKFLRCPVPEQTVDDGGATTGIDDFTELAACLNAQASDLASSVAAQIMGLPSLPLSAALASCHGALGKAYTKYVGNVIKARAKCQSDADKALGEMSFACVTADPDGKIEKARLAAKNTIKKSCVMVSPSPIPARSARTDDLAALGSCGNTADALADCAVDVAATTVASGAAAMSWELPGTCPGSGSYAVTPVLTDTKLDVGWTGLGHHMEPVLGFKAVNFDVGCDPDCGNCSSSSPTPVPDACRCTALPTGPNADPAHDASHTCSSNADCGAASCRCYFGPPTPYAGGGASACVYSRIVGPMTGSLDFASGDMSLTVPLRGTMYTGQSLVHPCPRCTAGICDAGDRVGLACTPDASDATFGDVSYDCPPAAAGNISGNGISTTLTYTTGSVSMAFGVKCDSPYAGSNCACAACTNDLTIACNSNSECLASPNKCSGSIFVTCGTNTDCASANVGPCHPYSHTCQYASGTVCSTNTDCAAVNVGTCAPGTCTGTGGALALKRPNGCTSFACTAVPGSPEKGLCGLATPLDTFCDGFLRSNGRGLIACYDDSSCDAYVSASPDPSDWFCPGNVCGTCTMAEERECFLNPVTATGEPGAKVVAVGCMGGSANTNVNETLGLPGAYRVQQNVALEATLCSDGVTPFIPPGGSNCP